VIVTASKRNYTYVTELGANEVFDYSSRPSRRGECKGLWVFTTPSRARTRSGRARPW
jgi:hypothetical protein